jgi:hypothetical protein
VRPVLLSFFHTQFFLWSRGEKHGIGCICCLFSLCAHTTKGVFAVCFLTTPNKNPFCVMFAAFLPVVFFCFFLVLFQPSCPLYIASRSHTKCTTECREAIFLKIYLLRRFCSRQIQIIRMSGLISKGECDHIQYIKGDHEPPLGITLYNRMFCYKPSGICVLSIRQIQTI